MVHRQDLHDEVKRLALDLEREGPVPELYLSSKVARIDAEAGLVSLDDGSSHKADLIVGADGIYVRPSLNHRPNLKTKTNRKICHTMLTVENARARLWRRQALFCWRQLLPLHIGRG